MNTNLAQPASLEDGTEISFRPLSDEPGLEIIDPIDRHRYTLQTPSAVEPRPASTEEFQFPVDEAVEIEADGIALPNVVNVRVHDETGKVVASADHAADEQLDAGQYSIGLTAPIKVYIRVESSVHITSDVFQTTIEFDEGTTVTVGARSHHEHPAESITTSDDPEDMMAAISAFGSALKTTSVERSYPTLRGHPPTIELGDELDIPDGLETPDTGVTIELPPKYEYVYVAAPIAYYLGANVEPGGYPRIVTDTGFEYDLDTERGFEREVERVLKQTFFLDCLTRSEGFFQDDLYERSAVEKEVDLDFEDLYDRPLTEQFEAYFEVPFDILEPHIPEWKVTTHVSPLPSSIETLPFLVNDLAVVRTPETETIASSSAQSVAVNEFFRSDGFTRSTSSSTGSNDFVSTTDFVQPESSDSLEEVWIGDETPLGANKATATAYRHHLNRASKTGHIDITVVCNDAEMEEEGDFVDDAYGAREELPFEVTVRRDLTTDELASLLQQDTDFFHYIGHIEAEGFLCSDGLLDAKELDEVGVDAFLLNACTSYEQGMTLIDRGSIAGVVTLSDVLNSGAVRIGCAMARLLNRGFPLRAAMNIARDESFVGGQYIVIGDGGLGITQVDGGTPILLEVEQNEEDTYAVMLNSYPTSSMGLGSVFTPFIKDDSSNYLSSGTLDTFELDSRELERLLSIEERPVRIAGRLHWSTDLDLEDIQGPL